MPTDEIYDRYLEKAISEINDLGDEIARGGDETHVPVLGSRPSAGGRLPAQVRAAAAEVQEGVAFYGRAGQALLKSLQRLRVDPMEVYGTNCLKFAGQDPAEARALARARAAHRPAEAARRDGRATPLAFVNALAFPLADALDADGSASCSASRRTIEALVVPDIDAALDEAAGEDRVLERLQGGRRRGRPSCRRTESRRWVAAGVVDGRDRRVRRGAGSLWDAGLWPDILFLVARPVPG